MTIRSILHDVANANPDRPLLWYSGKYYGYGDALAFSECFAQVVTAGQSVLLVSDKSVGAYFTIFAAIIGGATYIPVNKAWNISRIENIIAQVRPDILACDFAWASTRLGQLAAQGYQPVSFDPPGLNGKLQIQIFRREDTTPCALARYRADTGIDDILYTMFTSGSTGQPKGVPVPRACVDHYITSMQDTFDLHPREKWIQSVELNFDLSVHDMLLAWSTAGCIVSIPSAQSPMGPRFVNKLGVENWLSVPSSAARSVSLGLLKENAMPSLKRSFFCGEALPSDVALAWSRAAPNAPVYNIYGPTEATIAFSWHLFDTTKDMAASVPIGTPLPGLKMRLSSDGEIELGGPQVFAGYLGNPDETANKLYVGDDGVTWYRTGDRGAGTPQTGFDFAGRLDWQVKIRGNRIETGEVEHAIRQSVAAGLVAVVPVDQVLPGSYDNLCAFIDIEIDQQQLRAQLSSKIPQYMVPEHCFTLARFPYNSNGKVDRIKLVEIAQARIRDSNKGP